jgi:tRNA(adenine34) deaminase
VTDEEWISLAATVAKTGSDAGELPYGAVVVDPDGNILATSAQWVKRDNDLSRHAETCALQAARANFGSGLLQGCTLYSTVEPCAMCSFLARLSQVDRVVFGLYSPIMGGYSQWPILQDATLEDGELGLFDLAFGPNPQVAGGVGVPSVVSGWLAWNAIAFEAMIAGGVFKESE